MPERTILETPDATITTRRAILNGKTYALKNITSVAAHSKPRTSGLGWAMIAAGGVCIFLAAKENEALYIFVPAAAIFVAFGLYLMYKAPPFISLRITTNDSGQQVALWDKPMADIEAVAAAINEAMATTDDAAPAPANSQPATVPDDPMAKIAKLKALLDAGAITEEEFASKKAELLEQV